ncbi:STAS domain-containing protein [Azospirillum sp. sgz301742]
MHTNTPFAARVDREADRMMCALSGMLTYNSYSTFRPLLDAVDAHGEGEVVLDLGDLHFLDSNGLGMLLVLRERATAAGRRMRLINVSPRVDKVLVHTHTQEMFGAA